MKIIIAPDSFKGSISAHEFTDIAYEEIKGLNIEVLKRPLSDGGEGSLDIIHKIKKGELKYYDTFDAYKRMIKAPVLFIDKEAYIESAKVIGLGEYKNILEATSYGLGYLIKQVIKDVKVVNVFLGGTATNDAGKGMLEALEGIDYTKTTFNIMCDVTNPLYGENGATKVFSRQKGANEETMEILEERIKQFSKGKEEYINRKGAGAAGGLGFAFMAYMKANYYSGVDYMIDLYDDWDADIIITGEGKYDNQSLDGKVISGLKRRFKTEIVIFCGKAEIEGAISLNSSMDIVDTKNKLRQAIRDFLVRRKI